MEVLKMDNDFWYKLIQIYVNTDDKAQNFRAVKTVRIFAVKKFIFFQNNKELNNSLKLYL